MLSIYFGSCENEIYNPPMYFKNQYEDEWIIDDLSKAMILDIDKSQVIGSHLIESPVLGAIGPERLSGGVQTLMLMAFDTSGKVFNASAGGDNCAKWILEIAKRKDLTITLHNIMNFAGMSIEAKILNDGRVVHDAKEYVYAAIDYV